MRNVVRIITETGLRVYKELMPMKKEQVDLGNGVAWIPDSKTPYGMAEVPTTQVLFGKRHFNESGVVRPNALLRVVRSAHLALDTGPAEILLRVQTCDTTDFNGGYLERSQGRALPFHAP